MSKQQTAVQWLFEELKKALSGKSQLTSKDILDQAHAMEKKQIIKAFNEGTFSEMEKIDAEDYYNQTYGLPTEH